ncbi:hypothetical protein VM1G_01238 [Cytospora mali]|uniref:Cytochrome P450 n=1 Tax=Cytospora mali TaxID=578113 RepID=A0A194VN17_CYTMA|nr:hypothetical protein VM1G_01238 [Valsa mali]
MYSLSSGSPLLLLWGHLKVFDEFTKRGITDRHPDAILADMREALGNPPILLVDNWPIVPPMVVVASHEVAEQVSRPSKNSQYSVPKLPSVDRIVDLIGPNSILLKQNEKWKPVRKKFNPGFAPQHLMTVLPVIIEKTRPYLEVIDGFVSTGEELALDQPTTNLTFDVTGAVTMGEDMSAQNLDACRQGQLTVMVKELIKNVESLTPEIMEETCDQLKTFLFAGHDSTSPTIIWSMYELFVREKLLAPEGDELVNRMPYISAVIKEAMRLHPPAGSIRMAEPGAEFVVFTPQGEYNLDGKWTYLNHSIIHRDRAVFGDRADDFVPERWLQSDGAGGYPAKCLEAIREGPKELYWQGAG